MTALGGAGQESDGLEQSRSKFPFSGGGDEQYGFIWASQVALVVKNPPANAGDIRDAGSIPGSGRSPGGGHGNPLQYSCLENAQNRGAWWVTVHRVTNSWTQLKHLRTHTGTHGLIHCYK